MSEPILHFPDSTLHICPGCEMATWDATDYCASCCQLQAEMEARYAERKRIAERTDSLLGSLPRIAADEDDSGMDGRMLPAAMICAAIGTLCIAGAWMLLSWGLHRWFPHSF
ncbi:MAG TPA: hypothetical protein VM554_13065 [Acidisarcina sp.]|nr:hypothetical protein [Acidisarcina sp.]